MNGSEWNECAYAHRQMYPVAQTWHRGGSDATCHWPSTFRGALATTGTSRRMCQLARNVRDNAHMRINPEAPSRNHNVGNTPANHSHAEQIDYDTAGSMHEPPQSLYDPPYSSDSGHSIPPAATDDVGDLGEPVSSADWAFVMPVCTRSVCVDPRPGTRNSRC